MHDGRRQRRILIAGEILLAGAAVLEAALEYAVTGNTAWLLWAVMYVCMAGRSVISLRRIARLEEECLVWQTLYDMKADEVLELLKGGAENAGVSGAKDRGSGEKLD